MSTYDPIVGTGDFPKLNLFGSRPTVEPGVALVVYSDKGDVLVLMPGQRLTAGDVAWKNYKGYFKVDIGVHNLEFQTKVPCNKDAFSFEAKLQITCQVEKPDVIVKNKIRDVLAALKPEIENRMRTISRKYSADQSEDAEQEINNSFKSGLHVNGIFASQIISNLELPTEAREHIHKIQSTKNEIARQEVAYELESTKLRYENELAAAKLKHENDLKKQRMDFYAPLIKKGQWNLLALQLAEHPEDVASIVNLINQQQQADRENQLKMLKIMLEEDFVEGFQVEEVRKRILQKLLDSLGPVNTKALTDGSAKATPEKSKTKKRKKKTSKEDVIDEKEADETSEENEEEGE